MGGQGVYCKMCRCMKLSILKDERGEPNLMHEFMTKDDRNVRERRRSASDDTQGDWLSVRPHGEP